jgi:phosphoserine phosphatase
MKYIAVTILGRDTEGILSRVIDSILEGGSNIIDIQQSVVHGILSLFLLTEGEDVTEPVRERIVSALSGFGLSVDVHEAEEYVTDSFSEKFVITIIGRDSGEMLQVFARTAATLGINNIRINMLSRGDLSAMQFLVDLDGCSPVRARHEIESALSKLGVDVVFEPESTFRMGKKLIVFDMDSTLVSNETIDELAEIAGIREDVSRITKKAMDGEIDYIQSIRERVRLLKGMPSEVLEEMKSSLTLNPGARELISSLRSMKYRIALVSGGFTVFTEKMKEELQLDYAFGNRLEVKDNRLTGNLEEPILDARGKQRVIEEIMMAEGISASEVVVVGDGANDTVMVKNAGLGIAFRGKEVLRKVADGTLSKSDLRSILYCLGHYGN